MGGKYIWTILYISNSSEYKFNGHFTVHTAVRMLLRVFRICIFLVQKTYGINQNWLKTFLKHLLEPNFEIKSQKPTYYVFRNYLQSLFFYIYLKLIRNVKWLKIMVLVYGVLKSVVKERYQTENINETRGRRSVFINTRVQTLLFCLIFSSSKHPEQEPN